MKFSAGGSNNRTRFQSNNKGTREESRPIRCGMWTRVATEAPTRYQAGPNNTRPTPAIRRKD